MYECAALRPPFLASDIPSLSKKITSGHFDSIPSMYSQRMEDIIRWCLKVNHRERPSAADIMRDNVFKYMHDTEEGSVNLLSTIRCPRVLKMLQQKLPEVKTENKRKSSLIGGFKLNPSNPPL